MIDDLIGIALGILVTLMGFGKINVSKDPVKNQEYLARYGIVLRVGGIVLCAVSFLLFVKDIF